MLMCKYFLRILILKYQVHPQMSSIILQRLIF